MARVAGSSSSNISTADLLSSDPYVTDLIDKYLNNSYRRGQHRLSEEISEHLGRTVTRAALQRYLAKIKTSQQSHDCPHCKCHGQSHPTNSLYVIKRSADLSPNTGLGLPKASALKRPLDTFTPIGRRELGQPTNATSQHTPADPSEPLPFYTFGCKPRLRDRQLIAYEGPDTNYMFTPRTHRKGDGADTYLCLGCHRAKYKHRFDAVRMGQADAPDVNRGDSMIVVFMGDKMIEQYGRHHVDCEPMDNLEIAKLRVKRAEREFICYVKETAEDLEVPQAELRGVLRTFPLREWPLDKTNKKGALNKDAMHARARLEPVIYEESTSDNPEQVLLYSADGVHTTYTYVVD